MGLNNDDIKQLIAILQRGLTNDSDAVESNEPKPKKKKSQSKIVSKKVTQRFEEVSENKFLTMPERNLHKEDTQIDKLLNKLPPTPRTRRFKTINVVCRSCGRKEEVSPSLVNDTERYKCNNCSTSAS